MSTVKVSKSRKAKSKHLLLLGLFIMLLSLQLFPLTHADVQDDFMTMLNSDRANLGLNPLAINEDL